MSIAHEFALMGFYLLSAASVVAVGYLIYSHRKNQSQTDNRIDQTQSAHSEQVINLHNEMTDLVEQLTRRIEGIEIKKDMS